MTISEAAGTNDRRATLEAMRDKLARDMDDAPAAVVAQIAGRLSAILAELDGIGPMEVSTLDELESRRKDRISTTVEPLPAIKPKRQRRA